MREACDEPGPDRIEAPGYDNRHGFRYTLQRLRHEITAARNNHIELETNQFSRDLIDPLKPPLRGPTLQHKVLALDVSEGTQPMHEGFGDGVDRIRSDHHGKGGRAEEISNAIHFDCLLRPRGERPRSSRAAEQRDKLAPFHSITSSAVESSLSGTVRPSIRAVSMLMTSSNLVACTTGKSAGFSPLRMRPA